MWTKGSWLPQCIMDWCLTSCYTGQTGLGNPPTSRIGLTRICSWPMCRVSSWRYGSPVDCPLNQAQSGLIRFGRLLHHFPLKDEEMCTGPPVLCQQRPSREHPPTPSRDGWMHSPQVMQTQSKTLSQRPPARADACVQWPGSSARNGAYDPFNTAVLLNVFWARRARSDQRRLAVESRRL